MALTAALLGLAQLAPAVMGLFTKNETAQKAAGVVSTVAQAVTGKGSDDEALEALKADPKLLLEYQQGVTAQALALYQEETKRLEAVNETIRTEAMSADPVVRRWRPIFGYCAAATWTVQGLVTFGVMAWVALFEREHLGEIIGAMTKIIEASAQLWLYALVVLGVAVWKRSADKAVAAGQPPAGPLAAIQALLKK